MITYMNVSVEEALLDIGMNSRIVVIHLEYDGDGECINSLED